MGNENISASGPRPKPEDVASPVPNTGATASSFEEYEGITAPSFEEFDTATGSGPAEAAPPQVSQGLIDPNSAVGGALETAAEYLPAAGGIAGGFAGGLSPASIPLAMFGAAAGTAAKQIILQNVLGRIDERPQIPNDMGLDLRNLHEMKEEAGTAGLGSLVGLGMSKGGAKALQTKYGQKALDYVAEKAAKPLAAVKETFDKARGEIFEKVDKIFAGKLTPMNGEQAGNFIKSKLVTDINNRYSGFIKSYGELDQVAQEIPLGDVINRGGKVVRSPRTGLTDKVRDWAVDQPQGTYKNIKTFTDRFDQAGTGRDYLKVLSDLQGEAAEAAKSAAKYNSNAIRDRAAALQRFADEAEAYYEDRIVGGLAKRIADGKATPMELEGFQRMMAQQANPNVPVDPNNLSKYTRSVASDYLKQKDTVRAAYKEFRGLLEDIGDVAKVNPSKLGPRQFARALEEVPADKLAERAFDPKNAQAMRILEQQYPEVYDTIIRNKMSSIIAKNTNVAGEINYKGIAEALSPANMPESASRLLMKSDEYAELLKAVNHPRLQFLDQKHSGIVHKMAFELAKLGELSRTGGKAIASRPSPLLPKTSQAVGQGLSQAFYPEE